MRGGDDSGASSRPRRLTDLCLFYSPFLQTSKVYNKNSVEKGIAFPTMVSVNDCVEYYSPTGDAGDDYVLKQGDVVKMYVHPKDLLELFIVMGGFFLAGLSYRKTVSRC